VEPLTIRRWRPGDAAADHVASVYAEYGLVFDPVFEDDLADIARVYAHGAFYVAEDASGLIGTCGVAPSGGARVIKRMYVGERGRRRGIARALLRRCMEFGDFARTELWSDVRFREAHAMYRAEGFTPGPCRVLDDPDRSVERYFRRG
jgi:GNAT superfamily N-acetyltransferase